MQKRQGTTRRQFLAAASGAVAAPLIVPSSVLCLNGAVAANDHINVTLVGSGGMGRGNSRGVRRQKGTKVVAVCDVDKNRGAQAKQEADKDYGNKDCKQYTDFREIIGRKDIDAIIIATPDHWHGPICVAAAKAKKHIYCQKPMVHTFAEGQAVVAAVKESGVIFQTGSQQRSQGKFRHATNLVLNGLIGKIKRVEVGLPTGHKKHKGSSESTTPPGHADYDFWCGPSPKLQFHKDRFHWNWRWHLSYGGGQLMDWIGHHNDIAHWGLECDKSGPLEVKATGFQYPEDRTVWNSAYNYEVLCKYEGGIESSISNRHRRGCKWIGEDGWVFVSRGPFEASNKEWTKSSFNPGPKKAYNSPEHHRNWIDGIKNNKECICPAETGHRSITPGHLGLVSEALGGRTLKWDPKKEVVVGDAEADKLLKKVDFRKPWTI